MRTPNEERIAVCPPHREASHLTLATAEGCTNDSDTPSRVQAPSPRKERLTGLTPINAAADSERGVSWCPSSSDPLSPTAPRSPGQFGPGTRRGDFVKDSRQHALIRLEALSRAQSKMLFTIVYVMVAGCLGVSCLSYWFQYACSNICPGPKGDPLGCEVSSQSCMTVHRPNATNATITVEWEGAVDRLSFYNRFVHFQWSVDNPYQNASNSSLVTIETLTFQASVYSPGGELISARWLAVDEVCAWAFAKCELVGLPWEGVPLQRGSRLNITLVGPSAPILTTVGTALLSVKYQRKQYTVAELWLRYALIILTVGTAVVYVRRLRAVPAAWLTEQQYILGLLAFLLIYLDPLYAFATYTQRHWGNDRGWPAVQFVEYHNTVYFLGAMQVSLAVLMTSVRRSKGRVSAKTHMGWLTWFGGICAVDCAVGVLEGDESAYTWTLYNFWLHKAANSWTPWEATAVGYYVVSQAVWAWWTIRATLRSRASLAAQGYFETRHRQLSFRYLAFLMWGFLAYWVTAVALQFGAAHRYGKAAYRADQEIGAVVMSFCTVMVLAFIYSPAPHSADAPPAPYDPTWGNPRWKQVRWEPEWFEWVGRHGGSLYFFTSYREIVRWIRIQTADVLRCTDSRTESPRMRRLPPAYRMQAMFQRAAAVPRRLADAVGSAAETLVDHLGEALYSDGVRCGFFRCGDLRLFFCLEVSIDLLNLCYRVYFPPSAEESPGLPRRYPTGSHCRSVLGALTAAAAVAAEAAGVATLQPGSPRPVSPGASVPSVSASIRGAACAALQRAPGPLGARIAARCSPREGAPTPRPWSPAEAADAADATQPLLGAGGSPNGAPGLAPDSPAAGGAPGDLSGAAETGAADVASYGWVLYEHIEQQGMQVFLCVDANPTRGMPPRLAIVFRGTDNRSNVGVDASFWRERWDLMSEDSVPGAAAVGLCTDPLIHGGFLRLWLRIEEVVMHALRNALARFCPTVTYITGHSLGGALATVCAYTARRRLEVTVPLVVYTFGAPLMGNAAFQQRYNARVPNTFRVVNELDIVTRLGLPCVTNLHIGREVAVDRAGHIVVEPTWIERCLNPAKRGASLHAHGLSRYSDALNAVASKYDLLAADGTPKRALVRRDFDESAFARRWAVVGPEDGVAPAPHPHLRRAKHLLSSPLRTLGLRGEPNEDDFQRASSFRTAHE
eukprot:TRINITY_DN3957_c0_g1_i1.p1 TRINITY_DN3957_c0_g1~~TRINITY_DN3957_c0_g1_i1.p1  ORF type:complete len:1184 (+),score=292.62 TRINITY_DN3957_c0_g1_i1:139-3690(+)